MNRLLSDSIRRATANELLQKFDSDVNLVFSHVKTGSERKYVLVIAANIKYEAHPATACLQVALHPFHKNFVGQLPVGLKSVFPANLDAQRHPHAVRVAYHLWI